MKIKLDKEKLSKILVVFLAIALLASTVGARAYNKRKDEINSQTQDVEKALKEYSYSDEDEEELESTREMIQTMIDELSSSNQQKKYQKKLDTYSEVNNFKNEMKVLAYDKDERNHLGKDITNDALMLKYDITEEKYQEIKEDYSNLSKEAKKEVDNDYKDLVKSHDYVYSKDSKIHSSYSLFYDYSNDKIEEMYKELEELNPSSYPDYFGVSEFKSMLEDRLNYLNTEEVDDVYSFKSIEKLCNSMKRYDSNLDLSEVSLFKDIQIYDSESNRDVYIFNVNGMLVGTDKTGYKLLALSDINSMSNKNKALSEALENSNIFFSPDRSEENFQELYNLKEAPDNLKNIAYLSENAMLVK